MKKCSLLYALKDVHLLCYWQVGVIVYVKRYVNDMNSVSDTYVCIYMHLYVTCVQDVNNVYDMNLHDESINCNTWLENMPPL